MKSKIFKRMIVIGSVALISVLSICLLLLWEHDIDFQQVGKIEAQEDFLPMAYSILDSEERLDGYIASCDYDFSMPEDLSDSSEIFQIKKENHIRAKEFALITKLKENQIFDFKNYKYIICHGSEVNRMYYSLYNTLFKDNSAWHKAWEKGHHLLFIEYANGASSSGYGAERKSDGYIYVYRIPQSENITKEEGP